MGSFCFRNYNIGCLAFLLLLSCSIIKPKAINFSGIQKIEVIKLPNDMDIITGLITEEMFDAESDHWKDRRDLHIKEFKLILGDKVSNKFLDIRTKVIIHYTNGKKRKFFLDRFGRVMCKNKIYEGSLEMMNFLREE